ncbi:MAG: membrane protein insertase YidC [Lachnospiraceae bacterium]|nr:membrane protein insertase YidC [Lachnospiraceae bacterium]
MMGAVGQFFGWCMYLCYRMLPFYGPAIILFTLVTKVILLPISILVQKNSIKMVQMYPELNRIKVRCFGNKDMISEEQYALYKKNNYHPMLDIVPVVAQLIILMGVADVIRQPAGYLKDPALDMFFCGLDLGRIPYETGGIYLCVPVVAAASAWLMCFTQNRSNVLQSEQSKANQWITLILSVGLSLYLGAFVPSGMGLYWVVSNLLSIVQMYLLNFFIDPKKYIDYEALAKSRKELADMQSMVSEKDNKRPKEVIEKEKTDYKRFLEYEGKQVVFYSEKNGFYKYFEDVIVGILEGSDVVIHYITSDPDDDVFKLADERFRVYYIGENKLIVLMMKMDADVVVLTTPDLQKYHIKHSMVREDIEYIYMDHAVASANLTLRKHALDAFDTVFVTNERMAMEMRAMEEKYDLPKKKLIKYGYALIDNMIAAYGESHGEDKIDETRPDRKPDILIAPSWQTDNIMDLCIEEVLDRLGGGDYHVIVRPHPQYVRHFEDKLNYLSKKYEENPCIEFQLDFSSNKTVFDADVLITDWSGIAYEYAFTTLKPVLFINTPMKIMNPDYKEIDVIPFDIEARDQVGISVAPDKLDEIADRVNRLLTEEVYSKESLRNVRDKYLYNVGKSAEVGTRYILRSLLETEKRYESESVVIDSGVNEDNGSSGSISEERSKEGFIKGYPGRLALPAILLLFPAMMIGILGPLEIYAGNVSELFFGTKDFFWMFLAVSLLGVAAGAAVIALFPEKIRTVLNTLIFAVSIMCYAQNMFLNKQLIKTDGSKMDWSLFREYTIVNTIVWIAVIAGICVLSFFLRKKRDKLFGGVSLFLIAVQLVAVCSLLFTNPYTVTRDKMYALSGEDEFALAPGDNVILLIIDRYSNGAFDNLVEAHPETEQIFKDFTYYNNANSKYNYTFPSIPYMLTLVDPDCSLTANDYKEQAWENGRSGEFYELLHKHGYTYNLYTGSGRAVYRDPSMLLGSVDNVTELDDVAFVIHYDRMFKLMTKTSLLKYAPYVAKPKLEVQSFYFDGLVTFEGTDTCTSDNGDYYDILMENGLHIDEGMQNALIITHLNGIHNPLTIDEHVNHVEDDSVSIEQVQQGLNIILAEYFEQLKELGVYDDATIIITADHGQYIDSLDLQPIYLIKPAGQTQDSMTVNAAPISSEDFIPTVLSVIGEDYSSFGTSIFDHVPGESRVRSSAYPHAGFDVYTYDGNRDTLREMVVNNELTRIQATEDWD